MERINRKDPAYMLYGSLWDKILLFALPLAATGILQQLFNAADVAVVGRFAGSNALAAVGANTPIINLMINIFIGLSVGANVVIANCLGAQNHRSANDAVHTSIAVSVIGGLFLMAVGLVFGRVILTWMGTPADIMEPALTYFKIFFAGMPFMMLYNFAASCLRSRGDTKRPLIILIISGIINVGLNLLFVICLHMTVEGVALATVIANVFSSMVLVVFLLNEKGPLKLEIRKLRIHGPLLMRIAKVGIPAGMQGALFNIANVLIQTAINDLGSAAVAASSVALNYEFYAYFLLNSFEQASVTFISQNRGGGNYERCRRSAQLSCLMGISLTTIVGFLFLMFAKPLVAIFTSDPEVIELTIQRMKMLMTFEFFNAYLEIFSGNLRGFGYSLTPALLCIAGIFCVRMIWLYGIYPHLQTFTWLFAIYPISWAITCVGLTIAYVIVIRKVKASYARGLN